MRSEYIRRIMLYLRREQNRTMWKRILYGLACIVVFFTVYALILPAVTMEQEYYCGVEAHEHSEDCYEYTAVEQIVCPAEELALHEHSASCFNAGGNAVCGFSDAVVHSHDECCFGEDGTLICAYQETAEHTHSEVCFNEAGEMVCGLPELMLHTHSAACRDKLGAVVCGYVEVLAHQHSDRCTVQEIQSQELVCELAVHVHDYNCKPDTGADLETAADWEQTVAGVSCTDVWGDDLVAIARTQFGYRESERNYLVENGERLSGYTRYGAWFGTPYADWDALFVSFCLNYAQIPYEAVSRDSDSQRWADTLAGHGILFSGDAYTPAKGDLVFFRNEDGAVSRVGIFTAMDVRQDPTGETQPVIQIWAIEGDADNAVAERASVVSDGCTPLYCSLAAARERYEAILLGQTYEPAITETELTESEYEPADEAQPEQITQTAETENYIVTVTYSSELELPEGAVLQVVEYSKDSEIFRQRCEEAGYELAWLLNIGFFLDGTELDLDGDFDVVVTSKQGESLGSDITHFGDEGSERISGTEQAEEGQSSVSFSSGGFSDYGGGVAAAAETNNASSSEKAAKESTLALAASEAVTYYKFITADPNNLQEGRYYAIYCQATGTNTDYVFLFSNANKIPAIQKSASASEPKTVGGEWEITADVMGTTAVEDFAWQVTRKNESSGEALADGTFWLKAMGYDTEAYPCAEYLHLGRDPVQTWTGSSNENWGYITLSLNDINGAGCNIACSASGKELAGYDLTNSQWHLDTAGYTFYFAEVLPNGQRVEDNYVDESNLPAGTYYKFETVNPSELAEGTDYVIYCRPNNTTDNTSSYIFAYSQQNVPAVEVSTISALTDVGYLTNPVTDDKIWYVPAENMTGASSMTDFTWKAEFRDGQDGMVWLAAQGYDNTNYDGPEYFYVNGTVGTYYDTDSKRAGITLSEIDGAGCKIYGTRGKLYVSHSADNSARLSGVADAASGYTFYFAKVEEKIVGEQEETPTAEDATIYYPYHLGDEDYSFMVMEPEEQFVEGQSYVIYYVNYTEKGGTYPGVKFLGSRGSENVSVPIGVNKTDPTTQESYIDAELDSLKEGGYRWSLNADALDTAAGSNDFLWVAEYDENGNLRLHSKKDETLYLYLDYTRGDNKNSVRTMKLDNSGVTAENFNITTTWNTGDDSAADSWREVSSNSGDAVSSLYITSGAGTYVWTAANGTSALDESSTPYKFYIAKAMSYPTAVKTGTVVVDALRFYNFAEDGFKGDGQTSTSALAGCTFVITDSNGNVIETIVTESELDPEINLDVTKYSAGTYTITEVSVPAGYAKDDNPVRTFIVVENEDGELYFAVGDDGQYESIGIFINHKLSQVNTTKSAQYHDYVNRIYEVMLTASSNMREYAIDPIDILFVVDQSNSMLFPSGLVPVTNKATGAEATVTLQRSEYADGATDEEKAAIDEAETANNVKQFEDLFENGTLSRDQLYYIVADKDQKSTVYAVWYDGDGWIYQDASFYAKAYYGNGVGYQEDGTLVIFAGNHATNSGKTVEVEITDEDGNTTIETRTCKVNGAGFAYRLGYDLGTDITTDNGGKATYTLYTALDSWNRLHYLQDSLANAVYQLSESNTQNRVKLILFTKTSTCPDVDTQLLELNAANVETLVDAVGRIYTTGGTRQDIALEHAYDHLSNAAEFNRDRRYTFTVLITDGAPNAGSSELGAVTDPALTAGADGVVGTNPETGVNDDIALDSVTTEALESASVFQKVRYWADKVKTESILMTIGLGMYDGTGGDILLEEIATTPDLYKLIENANALRETLKPMLFGAMVPKAKVYAEADLVDEISDSFYPIAWVENGTAETNYDNTADHRVVETDDTTRKWIVLEEGDWITLEGKYTTAGASDAAGQLLRKDDGDGTYTYYIEWNNQVLATAAGEEKVLAWAASETEVPSGRSVLYVESGKYWFELYEGEWVSKSSDQTNKFKYYGSQTVGEAVTSSHADYNLIGQLRKDDVGNYIYWNDQIPMNTDRDYPSLGWKGLLYLKAKEDFIGGNAIETNKTASAIVRTSKESTDAGTVKENAFGEPTVNVRLLPMTNTSSEITVFLGDYVNGKTADGVVKLGDIELTSPEQTLKQFYFDTYIRKIGWDANYVRNSSFEATGAEDINVWKWDYDDEDILIKNSENAGDGDDAYTGTCYLNFNDRDGDGINIDVYQTITGLEPGATYVLSAMVHGGDPVNVNKMHIYAKSGSTENTADFTLEGWKVWQNPTTTITVGDSGEVTVGVRVACDSAWGSIDDIVLYKLPNSADTVNKVDPSASAADGLEYDKFSVSYARALTTDEWSNLMKNGTCTVEYTYDHDSSNGPVGAFTYTIRKSDGASYASHVATQAGEGVETYTLNVTYTAYALGENNRPEANALNGVNGPGTEVGGDDAGDTLEKGFDTVTVANVHTVNVIDGTIEITKKIDSSMISGEDMTFSFTLHRTEDGTNAKNDQTETITVPAGETDGSASLIFTGLPRGTYTVREGTDADYHVSGVTVLSTTNCQSTPAIGGTAAEVEFVIGNDVDGADVINTYTDGDNYPYSDYVGEYSTYDASTREGVYGTEIDGVYGAAEFTNTKTKYEGLVTVSKIWSGDAETNADLHKNDVVYVVLYQNGSLVEDSNGSARMVKLTQENNWTASYKVALTDSTDRVYNYNYTVREVNQVSATKSELLWQGAVLENPSDESEITALYYDKILEEGETLKAGDRSYIATYQEATRDTVSEGETDYGNVSMTITNERAYELPETGGIGELILMVNGALFLTVALRYGYNQSSKRKRRAS